jgi:hypothetical protein
MTSVEFKSHTLHGPLLLFTARNFSSELKSTVQTKGYHQYLATNIPVKRVQLIIFHLKLRSLIDVLISGSARTDSMAGHLKTLKCPSYTTDKNDTKCQQSYILTAVASMNNRTIYNLRITTA